MAIYDIIMLLVIGAAILFGYWKGLAWQIASLAAIVVSYFVSYQFRDRLAQYISAQAPWNRIAAMLILFLGTSLVIWTIYAILSKSIQKMELKGFDRQAGALLGAAKGILLCMVITMFSVSLLGEKAHDAIHNSRSGRYIVWGIDQISGVVPPEIAKYIQPHVDRFHEAIGHGTELPFNEYPSNPLVDQPHHQDPQQVPTYPGTWLPPSRPSTPSYAGQPTQPPAGRNARVWGTGNTTPPSQNVPTSPVSNGWPDIQFRVNTRDLLDAARSKAGEAVRRAFEPTDGR